MTRRAAEQRSTRELGILVHSWLPNLLKGAGESVHKMKRLINEVKYVGILRGILVFSVKLGGGVWAKQDANYGPGGGVTTG